jgi:hypothetical protein
MPSGVSNLGPLSSPQINNQIVVGSILYPTIQSAVTAGAAFAAGATVLIPFGATPSDTVAAASGTTLIMIIDQRSALQAVYSWVTSAYVLSIPAILSSAGIINAGTGFEVAGVALASTNLSDSATIAHLSSNITGTAANVTGTVAIANGGTGATTATAALAALGALPLAGGTLTGTLTLANSTPTGLQAASANYVNAQIAAGGSLPTATAASQFVVSTGAGLVFTARVLASADIPNNAANTTGNAATATTAVNVSGTVAISNGGTGSTTAAAALTALGALPAAGGAMSGTFSGAPTFSGNLTFSGTSNFTGATPITFNGSAIIGLATTTSSATPVFNGAGGTVFPYTMAQNVTSSTTSNLIPGQLYTFEIIQAAGGTQYSFVWPTTMLNTSPISQQASQKSVQIAVAITGGGLLCLGPITYI